MTIATAQAPGEMCQQQVLPMVGAQREGEPQACGPATIRCPRQDISAINKNALVPKAPSGLETPLNQLVPVLAYTETPRHGKDFSGNAVAVVVLEPQGCSVGSVCQNHVRPGSPSPTQWPRFRNQL